MFSLSLFNSRYVAWTWFVASAALVAFAIHIGLDSPWFGAALVLGSALVLYRRAMERRRVQRLLTSGDVAMVVQAWQASLQRVPHAETMRPLVVATLLAAHGMIDKARYALGAAKRGHAWDAALEHRLVLETLIEAFDGERERALSTAARLVSLPIVANGPWMRARIANLRDAVLAFARSFAHQAGERDIVLLRRAAAQNPLVYWPMRYAAAVAHVDRGEPQKARELLDGAPGWPEESVFCHFHQELVERLSPTPPRT